MWHGTPDARVRGNEVVGRKVTHLLLDEDDDDVDEDDSDGESTGTCNSSGTDGARSTVEAN